MSGEVFDENLSIEFPYKAEGQNIYGRYFVMICFCPKCLKWCKHNIYSRLSSIFKENRRNCRLCSSNYSYLGGDKILQQDWDNINAINAGYEIKDGGYIELMKERKV